MSQKLLQITYRHSLSCFRTPVSRFESAQFKFPVSIQLGQDGGLQPAFVLWSVIFAEIYCFTWLFFFVEKNVRFLDKVITMGVVL